MRAPDQEFINGYVDMVVETRYQSDAVRASADLQRPFLPGFGTKVEAVALFITDVLWQAQAQIITGTRALARIAAYVSATLHDLLCNDRPPTPLRCCSRDVHAVSDLVNLTAWPHLGVELDTPLSDVAHEALITAPGREAEVEADLESIFQSITHPDWRSREPLTLEIDRPIIQINSAITHVTPPEYHRIRTMAIRLRDHLTLLGYKVEVTSDYAAPHAQPTCAPNESLTRAGIYRSSGVISIVDHGRIGTATTLAIADELLIPTLVLYQDARDISAARYPGGFSRRSTHRYDTQDAPESLVGEYLTSMRSLIAKRHRDVIGWSHIDLGNLASRFDALDPQVFERTAVTHDRARFFVSDPVLWSQCPPATKNEIEAILGTAHTVPTDSPNPSGRPSDASPTSISSLFIAAEHSEWPYDKVGDLYQRYLRLNNDVVSRHKNWGFDDWIRFEASP